MTKHLRKLPFVRTVLHYPSHQRWHTLTRFLFLWAFSLLPVLLSPFFGSFTHISDSLRRMFSGEFVTEQFIYSATLLPPWMLYLYDKYIERGQQHDEEKRRKKFDQDPPGFFFIVGAAVFILVIAACCYGAEKQAQGSILFGTTTTQAHKPGLAMLLAAYVTYFYSLYCWYTLMLVSADPKQSEYVEKCREGEVDFSQEFGRKLREDNDGDIE